MTAHLSRRSLLRATPALAVPMALAPAAIASAAVAPPLDPVPALVAAYFAAQEVWIAAEDRGDTEAYKAAGAELDQLRALIEGTTATTADGLLAQFAYIEEDFGGGFSEGNGETVSDVPVSLLHRIAVAVERLQ